MFCWFGENKKSFQINGMRKKTAHLLPEELLVDLLVAALSGDEPVKAARSSVEAVPLMLIAYCKAESINPNPLEQYRDFNQY